MRNLKRALSLGLTAAMISGLMVMGSSAASYADVTSENNVEAIEVLESVGIMIGDESGNFNPDQNVTRNEMAVVMANLMEYNVASYRDTSPFTDVPSWAEPYVAACWTNGITAGYSDTIYGGSDNVTTSQAALMLMKALGYFQYASDFGSDWQLATTRQGNAIDLFVGVDSGVTQAMTRNDVAQLVLNTLKSGTVEASTDGSWTIGDVTINNNVTYSYITSNQTYATAINDARSTSNNSDAQRSIVELGESLYMGDLKLDENAVDVFGRPARYWEYDGDEIGTYAKSELLREEYTTEVTGRDLYDLLGNTIVDTYTFNVTIDGVDDPDVDGAIFDETSINRNNRDGVGATGNGVLTQVYVDTDERVVDIAIINTYLAIADEDYNEKRDEVSLTVYGVDQKNPSDEYVKTLTDQADDHEDFDTSADEFPIAAEMVDGGAYLVTIANQELQSIVPAEVVENVAINSFTKGESVTSDGTTYDYADAAEYDYEVLDEYTISSANQNLKDTTYNIYLDGYGYAIGVDIVDEPNNYVFITGVDSNYSNLSARTLDANAIFLDGTMDTITINMTNSDLDLDGDGRDAVLNTWCTYSVNNAGVYTVEEVTNRMALVNGERPEVAQQADGAYDTEIDDRNIRLPGDSNNGYTHVYGNDASVYLTTSIDEIAVSATHTALVIDDVVSVGVGIDNVNIEPWEFTAGAGGTINSNITDADCGIDDVNAVSTPIVDNHVNYYLVSSGVYTLYGDDGYVIAAVVVGDDGGTATDFVYVNSDDLKSESYDETAEEWTWTRNVILNGEEVTLTEVDDVHVSMLDKMNQHEWYRVRYNADGEVISVTSPNGTGLDNDAADFNNWALTNASYQMTLAGVNADAADTAIDTIVYHEEFNNGRTVVLDTNRTLYETTTTILNPTGDGVRVAEDVKVVLIQMTDRKTRTIYETGYKELDNILDDLNADENGVHFELAMIVDEGRATSVIIRDRVEDGDAGQRPSGGVELPADITVSTSTMTVNVPVFIEDADKINDLARQALQSEGYTVTGVRVIGNDANGNPQYELTASKDGVSGYVFKTVATVYVTVSLQVADEVKENALIEKVELSNTVVPVRSGSVTVKITRVDDGNFTGTFYSQSFEADGETPISVEKPATGTSPLTFSYSNFTQNTIIKVYQNH